MVKILPAAALILVEVIAIVYFITQRSKEQEQKNA